MRGQKIAEKRMLVSRKNRNKQKEQKRTEEMGDRRPVLKRQQKQRRWFQTLFTLGSNSYAPGFLQGTIYQGPLKKACLPGLNCYSCPGALGACPLGALQGAISNPNQQISFYVLGFLTLTGSLLGRAACGWACPFGLVQDWLHRIPTPKWFPERRPRLHAALKKLKIILLALLVGLLPFLPTLAGQYGEPAFCAYICPSGTLLAGVPLLSVNVRLRTLAGWQFAWKGLLLLLVLSLAIPVSRPFCRYACPLGAIYGFFNRISLCQVRVDSSACTHCGACARQCPMAVPVPDMPDSAECIRCGECAAVCPTEAIRVGFGAGQMEKAKGSKSKAAS